MAYNAGELIVDSVRSREPSPCGIASGESILTAPPVKIRQAQDEWASFSHPPMRGKWLQRIRQVHTFLGVFFSPLLLLFIATGWWQTFQTEDDKNTDFFNATMAKFSNIHTDDYFTASGGKHHSSRHFEILVAGMAVALILTILMGLTLACQNRKRFGWTALAFLLGILVPALILYFN